MQQITLTLDLTAENLEKLRAFVEETGSKATSAPVSEPAETPTPAPAPVKKAAKKKEEPEEKITKTDVRAVALKLSKAGKSEELREIFKKFDAEKLSDVSEENYPELMKELTAAAEEIKGDGDE